MIWLPLKIRDEIISHASECLPLEACGILGGFNGIVTTVYRITNTDASPDHFLMDPREQIAAFAELELASLEIAAFYHSHPSGPEYPSAEDIRLSFYPDIPSFIVSLADPENPVIKAYLIKNGNFEPLWLKIIGNYSLHN
jgi:proteasome lid subunit RPN8/RPN11